ncbi:MAG: hypothetical protein R3B48_23800 [Kofleriaceae bacterium]
MSITAHRRASRQRAAAALTLGMALGGATRSATADQALSVGAGWAAYSTLGEPPAPMKAPPTLTSTLGGHVEGTYEHGISPEVSLRAELAGALFSGDGWSYAALADAGAVYRFDVIKYVPYGFAGLGAVARGGGPLDGALEPVVVIGGGLDVLRSRTQSWGLEARLASFAGDTTVFTLGLRASTRWGFF